MNAGQLAIILDHVAPDLPVIIRGRHIMTVTRSSRRYDSHDCPPYPNVIPASIDLGTMVALREAGWWEPAPPFQLHGAFRQRQHLYEQLGLR